MLLGSTLVTLRTVGGGVGESVGTEASLVAVGVASGS
jgi:hypothetical protein